MTLLQEMLTFTMGSDASTASDVFTLKAKKAKTPQALRTILAQVMQAMLAGQIRKSEFDVLKATLQQKRGAMRTAGKVEDFEKKLIVPGIVNPNARSI